MTDEYENKIRNIKALASAVVAQALKDIFAYPSLTMSKHQMDAYRFLQSKWAERLSDGVSESWVQLIDKDYELARLVYQQSGILPVVRTCCGLDNVTKKEQVLAMARLTKMYTQITLKKKFIKIWNYLVFKEPDTARMILKNRNYDLLFRYSKVADKFMKSNEFKRISNKLAAVSASKGSKPYEV